jgi:AraC-like DNA-binding protein
MNDALSSVLDMLRLQSAVYFGADFGPGWGMDVPAGSFASFHLVVAGECVLQSEQQHEPIQLGAGDIVLFPRGGCHWLASSVDAIRVPGSQVVGAHQQGTPLFSEAPVVTRLVCGHFELDRELDHPLIAELPEMVHIRDIERRRVEWLASVSAMLMTEADSQLPGAAALVRRLAEALLVQVLRLHVEHRQHERGFLAALGEPKIHQALNLIHANPGRDWTLESLGREVGMSRSSFSQRFRELVGTTATTYLTDWRLQHARQMLRSSSLPLAAISQMVGYGSEAAFHRAFKRRFQLNPGAMRRAFRTSTAGEP